MVAEATRAAKPGGGDMHHARLKQLREKDLRRRAHERAAEGDDQGSEAALRSLRGDISLRACERTRRVQRAKAENVRLSSGAAAATDEGHMRRFMRQAQQELAGSKVLAREYAAHKVRKAEEETTTAGASQHGIHGGTVVVGSAEGAARVAADANATAARRVQQRAMQTTYAGRASAFGGGAAEQGDTMYAVNAANARYNRAVEKSYAKATRGIKESMNRGTAL